MKYRAEIDGLRTVAVLPVVLFHAGVHAIPGGFAGVDVFFVISGFLITGIIAEDAAQGRFSIGRFYERRARRILPALFLVMLATLPAAWFVMVPYQLEDMAQSMVATLVFASNILFWMEADYFGAEAAAKPFLHTWSLAVEEQFYVVFPLLLVLLYRIGRACVIPVLAAAFAISLGYALVYGPSQPSASFYLIQFRAWELLAGSLAALWLRAAPPAPHRGLAAIGLAAIALSFFVVREGVVWPGPLTLLPVLGTACLLVFARGDQGVGRFLAWEPVRFVGLISYSLYLWHLPPLALLSVYYFDDVPAIARALAVVLAFVGAWASWRFVERPFRVPGRVRLLPFAGVAVAAAIPLLAFGLAGVRTNGFHAYLTAQIPGEYADQVINREAEIATRDPVWDAILDRANGGFASGPDMRKVLILGDSLSEDLMVATGGHVDRFTGVEFRRMRLDDRCMSLMVQVLNGAPVPGGEDRCAGEVDTVLQSGLVTAADEIVLAANWQVETIQAGKALALALAGKGPEISILGVAAFNDMASLSMRLHRIEEPVGKFFYRNIRSKFVALNEEFDRFAQAHPEIRFLDILSLFCDPETRSCDMLDADGRPVIFDSAHVTASGVDLMSERIAADAWFRAPG